MAIRRLSNSQISTAGRGKSSSALAGYSPAIDEMDLIQRVTVGAGGTLFVEFVSIPQTYQHLHLRAVCRDNRANSGDGSYGSLTFNNVTGTSYSVHQLYGFNSSSGVYGAPSQSGIEFARFADLGSLSSTFGVNIVDILDYTNTSKHKAVRAIAGVEDNSKGSSYFWSGSFMSTSAITSLRVTDVGGTLFSQNTIFSLYGVAG